VFILKGKKLKILWNIFFGKKKKKEKKSALFPLKTQPTKIIIKNEHLPPILFSASIRK
jgi:hypothetical protein